jgi:N-acetylglucosamine kinase-like BadF-type ATPase
MRSVLGFDGGGTKTDCVLMDESRQILARSRSGPSNPTRVGLNAALVSLHEAADKALAASRLSPAEIAAIHGGIAGVGASRTIPDLSAHLKRKFLNAAILLETDSSMALAATNEIPSLVVIAGTGSAVLGRNTAGSLARAGGLGPVLGDPGSAFDIGRKAVVLSLRKSQDGEDFPLGDQILGAFQCNWPELQDQIRANADGVLPKLFPIITKAANEGDTSVQAILQSSADELSELAIRVIKTLGLHDQRFFLAKTGGVFARSPFFDDRFDAGLAKIAPNARIGLLPMPLAEYAANAAVDSLPHTKPTPVRTSGD